MQIPAEIIAALVAVWIGLQLSILRQIGKLETATALNRQKIYDIEQHLLANRKRQKPPSFDSAQPDSDSMPLDPTDGV